MKKQLCVAGTAFIMAFIAALVHVQSVPAKTTTLAQPHKTEAVVPALQNRPTEAGGLQPSPRASEPELANRILDHLHASMILDYATYLVAAITAIFAIFLGTVGLFEYRQVEKLRREVVEERKELREERKDVHDERKALYSLIETAKSELVRQEQRFRAEIVEEQKASEARIGEIEALKPELVAQENRLRAYQRFLAAVLAHHSRLLLGIINSFGSALKPDEVRQLRSLISEAESALDLFHPDKSLRGRALFRLEHIGSAGSVYALAQLRDDPAEETDIRLRAQDVLLKVKARLTNEHTP